MRAASCFVSSKSTNHFEMNPERGGRPARDSRTSGVIVAKVGFLDQEMARVLIFVAWLSLNVKNAVNVITK